MALQIANPVVVKKVQRLAERTGLSKTAAVEKAVDRMLGESARRAVPVTSRMGALLAQLEPRPRSRRRVRPDGVGRSRPAEVMLRR